MARYLDEAAEPAERPKHRPRFCPVCKAKLVTLWGPVIQHRCGIGHFAVACPYFSCTRKGCGFAIRLTPLDSIRADLYTTRKAALAGGAKLAKVAEDRIQRRLGPLPMRPGRVNARPAAPPAGTGE